jgi:MFS family permease
MSQATGVIGSARAPYIRVVGAVSAAHFMSHYYIILLAPLMPFVRDEYQVTYTEIGLAFAVFNIVTGVFQTPAGFLVDRLGGRALLILGLAIGATSFVTAGLVDSFWVMIAMFGIAGMGNTVYHPADYTLLSQPRSGGPHWPSFFAAYLCWNARFRGCPSKPLNDAELVGLAWRLRWRWCVRLCRGAFAFARP